MLLLDVFHEFRRQFNFSVTYINNEMSKSKGPYCIGTSTVIIMVFLIASLLAGTSKTPGLFVMLAEDQTGEIDVLMTPDLKGQLQFLNANDIRRRLANDTNVAGIAPRWIMNGRLTDRWDPKVGVSTVVLAIDTRREKQIRIGRKWTHRVLGEGEMHVRDTILRQLGVEANVGDKVALSVDFTHLLSQDTVPLVNKDPASLLSPLITRLLNVKVSDTFRFDLKPLLEGFGYDAKNLPPITPQMVEWPLDYVLRNFGNMSRDFLGFDPSGRRQSLTEYLGISDTATWSDIYEVITGNPAPENITDLIRLPSGLQKVIEDHVRDYTVRMTIPKLLGIKVKNETIGGIILRQLMRFRVEYTVADSITASLGKYPAALGNIAVVDANHLLGSLLCSLCADRYVGIVSQYSDLRLPTSRDMLKDFDIGDYALMVLAMSKDRQAMYTKNKDECESAFIEFTNGLFNKLGISWPAKFEAPVMWTLSAFEILRLFLDQIVFAIIVVFVVLAALVVFTLLLSNADEKTYEYGMLRALGLPHKSLWLLILYQAITFSIPGIVIGLFLAFLLGSALEFLMTGLTGFAADYSPPLGWVFAAALGVFVPGIASVEPIRRALRNTLRDSLDVYHSINQQTSVAVRKLQELGLAGWQTSLAMLMIVVGFMVYYVLPFAFLFKNLPLFFGVLNLLLLGMLAGLAVIAQSLQSYLQSIFVHLLLWGRDKKLRDLVRKNMTAHRQRSKKTHLMFTLTVAVIIFGGVVFTLQTRSILETVKIFIGVDIRVESSNRKYPLKHSKLTPFLEDQKRLGIVDDFAFATFSLDSFNTVSNTVLTSLMEFPSYDMDVIGLDRNYLGVTFDNYLNVADHRDDIEFRYTPSGDWDVVDAVYKPSMTTTYVPSDDIISPRNLSRFPDRTNMRYKQVLPVLLSSAALNPMSATITSTLQLRIERPGAAVIKWLISPCAFITKMPGYVFSSYAVSLKESPIIVSMPTFELLLRESAIDESSIPEIHYKNLFVKLVENVTTTQRIDLINGLRAYIDPTFHMLQDTVDLEAVAHSTSQSIMLVYYIIAMFGILLCTFMLWLSFKANVMHNTWEFGVIRSIGLDVDAVVRVYVYEAVCLVLSGFTLGTAIGIFVALTLSLQFTLFSEMKLRFSFPYTLFILTVVSSFVAAVFGSYTAAVPLKSKRIVSVLKGI